MWFHRSTHSGCRVLPRWRWWRPLCCSRWTSTGRSQDTCHSAQPSPSPYWWSPWWNCSQGKQYITFTERNTSTHLRVLTHPSFQRDSRCLLITSRIPSIHSQKGNAFSLALCFRIRQTFNEPHVITHIITKHALTLQNLVQGMSPSGFLWALAPVRNRLL